MLTFKVKLHCFQPFRELIVSKRKEEGNVFNNISNTFYLGLYGVATSWASFAN